MVAVPTPVEIFCSYAHEDEAWLCKLEIHLSLLKRQDLISLWHDRLISPGTDWAKTIDSHLETASVILLLVSADFFASDYCYGIEMKRALEREEAGEARVIPILVRPVDWKDAPFAHLQALPTDVKPIASWQNKDTALADVAAGIRRVIVEELPLLTASAPRAALPKIWNIPYPRNPFFLGRESELVQVHQHLHTGQVMALSQPQAISGLGGIGKTQLALEYAYRYHRDYQAVLWARAESGETLFSSYLALAELLDLPEHKAKAQDTTVQAVKTWLQTHRGWLLILDNADELTIVPDFLPVPPRGHVLLTTRATATGRLASRLEIEILSPEQGALLLLRRAKLLAPDAELSQASAQEQDLALRISQELGGLPLALDQAGAYLEETGAPLADYWQFYQHYRAELLRERRGPVPDYLWSVATTWSLSFRRVEERNPAAAELLRLCAFLAPDAIPEEILTAGVSAFGPVLAPAAGNAFLLNQAIEVLRAYSLVRRDPTKKTLSIHRLVQTVLRDSMSSSAQKIWTKRVFDAMKSLFPLSEGYDYVGQSDRLISHARVCIADAQIWKSTMLDDFDLASLLFKMARYFHDRVRYEEATSFYQRALSTVKQLQELASSVEQISEDFNLASLFSDDIISLKQRLKEMLGPASLEVTILLNGLGSLQLEMFEVKLLTNLANLYRDQGKYEQAEPIYGRVLRFYDQELESKRLRVITSFNHLTNLIKRKIGSEYLDMVVPFSKQIPFFTNPTEYTSQLYLLAASLSNLANLYRDQGKYEQAEPLYQRAVQIFEKELGPDHRDVATSLSNLANLYADQGKFEQAEPLYQRALDIREKALGSAHPSTAITLNNLAVLYRKQGKFEQAESFYQRALDIQEKALGSAHPEVAISLEGLAILYTGQGKFEQAESFYQRALDIREKALGSAHPGVAYPLNNLANLYKKQGKFEQAESFYQRALHIWEQTLGSEHANVAYPLNNLADLHRDQSRYEQAEQLYQRALHIREQALGHNHPEVAYSLNGLANLYKKQGKFEQAEQLYQRALHICEQRLGSWHPETAEVLHDMAGFREAQEKRDEAKSLYTNTLAIREQALGKHHPKTTETRKYLIALLHVLGQHEDAVQLEAVQSEQ